MRVTVTALAASVASALLVQAGMYGEPVVNLDARTFKKVMATEHAAVGVSSLRLLPTLNGLGSLRHDSHPGHVLNHHLFRYQY